MPTASDFIGLTKKGAQDLAEKRNLIFRLIRKDDEQFFEYPEDVDDTRVCVEIDDGKVSKAALR